MATELQQPAHDRVALLERERAIRRTEEYRRGFEAGRRAAWDAVEEQRGEVFPWIALRLLILQAAFNATAKVAHDREALLEGWKQEAAEWKAEHQRVFDRLCDFTTEALAIVEGLVNEQLRQRYYLAKRLFPIRRELAPAQRPGAKKNEPSETWADVFVRLHRQSLESFVKEALDNNYLDRIYEYEMKTFGNSPLEKQRKERAA